MTLKRCANCANGAWTCREQSVPEVCTKCSYKSNGDPSEWKPINPTNADRIRAMSDEELAVIVRFVIDGKDCPIDGCNCKKCFFKELCVDGSKWYDKATKWLQKPVGVDHD